MAHSKVSGLATLALLDVKGAMQRQAIPFGVAVICVYLARDRFLSLELAGAWAALHDLSAAQWAGALAATGVSFWALGRYDEVVSRALGIGGAPGPGRRAGMAAIATSQMVGLGLITGALVRWRMLNELSLAEATRLTLTVSLTFLAGWSVCTSVATLALFEEVQPFAASLRLAAYIVLLLSALGLGLCVLRPHVRWVDRLGGWPLVPGVLRIVTLTAIDTLAACLVLYLLLPAAADLGYFAFLPVFLIAFGAGLMLGTPGGIGPFEVTLLTLLPDLAAEHLAGGILGYRVVYFALPAAVAAVAVIAGPTRAATALPGDPRMALSPLILAKARRAEVLLYRQGQHRFISDQGREQAILAGDAGHVLVGLFDPVGAQGKLAPLLDELARRARLQGRLPCLYKIGARGAAAARKAGWKVRPISHELWLKPKDYRPTSPARAGLRRKLRQAEAAGVQITVHCATDKGHGLPMAQMRAVSEEWRGLRGGERGFSIGRFAPDYLSGQRLYLAWKNQRLCGFASFHQGENEWALDLMRYTEDAPSGTMQSLISHAIADAAKADIPRLSLAAVPLPDLGLGKRWMALAGWLRDRSRLTGLDRFKSSFAPCRAPLYLAAPNWPVLAFAAFEIARAIRRPTPLDGRNQSKMHGPGASIQDHLDEVAFDNS